MNYSAGQKVRIKSIDWYNENKDEYGYVRCIDSLFTPEHSKYCGCEFTISHITEFQIPSYVMESNGHEWTDEMIEGLVEEEKVSNVNSITQDRVDKIACKIDEELPSGNPYEWECPEGYQFVDENGNVINATKIVLEKKKIVNLTQEQINTMVHDSCVLFCKHCGCGIPRDTCTSLGTCKEHDEYRDAIRVHLMENHKN